MEAYLVYVVIHNSIVNELSVKKDFNVTIEPIQFRDAFLRRCKEIFTREAPTPITNESKVFF